MKPRYYFLATLIFTAGLLTLDVAILVRQDKFRAFLETTIEDHLRLPVSYDDVFVESFNRIRVENCVVHADSQRQETLLTCQELRIRFDPFWFLGDEPVVQMIEMDQPELHLRWSPDGELRLPSLLKPGMTPGSGVQIPEIRIDDMTFVFEQAPFLDAQSRLTIEGLDVELEPTLSPSLPYRVTGTLNEPVFGQFEINGEFGEAKMRGQVVRKGFWLDFDHVRNLRPDLRDLLSRIRMNGELDLAVELSANDWKSKVEIVASAEARDVELAYRDWPGQLQNLDGKIRYANGRITQDGALHFMLENGSVAIDDLMVDLRGPAIEFTVQGRLESLWLDDELAEHLTHYPDPFPAVSDVLLATRAHGAIKGDFNLKRGAADTRTLVDVDVRFDGANLAYVGFVGENGGRDGYPFPLEKVTGRVTIGNDDLEFRDIRSTSETKDVIANGHVSYGRKPFGYRLEFVGHDIRLDEDVRMALRGQDREIYDSYEAQGSVDFDLVVELPEGSVGRPTAVLDVTLKGCRARPASFPLQLEDIRGSLSFGRPGGTRVDKIRARVGDATLDVDGVVDIATALDLGGYDLKITGKDLQVDEDLLRAMRREFPEAAAEIKKFGIAGLFDITCAVSSSQESEPDRFDVTMNGLSLRHEDHAEISISDIRGKLEVQNGKLRILDTALRCCGNPVRADGYVMVDGSEAHELTLVAGDFRLGTEALDLAASFAPELSGMRDVVLVDGSIGVELKLKRNRRGSYVRTRLDARGLTLRGVDEPWLVSDVWGTATIEDDLVEFTAFTGLVPAGDEPVELTVKEASYHRMESGKFWEANGIAVHGIRFEEPFYARLPREAGEALRGFGLTGSCDLAVDGFNWAPGEMRCRAEIQTTALRRAAGLRLGLPSGRIVVTLARTSDLEGWSVKGEIQHATLEIHKFTIEDTSADFSIDERGLALRKIRGLALGGTMNAEGTSFDLAFAPRLAFDTSLSLSTIDLSRLVAELGGNPRSLEGRASGRARLSGTTDDLATWKGNARFEMSGRRLYEIPFYAAALGLLSFDFLTMGENAVQVGLVAADISNMVIEIREALFEGKGIKLKGQGTIGFDGICNLDFSPKVVKWLDGIPILGDLISLGGGMIVSVVHVQGPIEDLDASAGNYITEIIPGGSEDSGRRLRVQPIKPRKDKDGRDQ
ncbi:MAG: hypothetical protein KDB53_07010 [Planctomycetes bacterium]|nr:hypothetical protein [Planctomycetota bacterium]